MEGDTSEAGGHSRGNSVGDLVRRAIVAEASSIKLGNVHPNASFRDMTYGHFVNAAGVLGEQIDSTLHLPIGQMVHACTTAMMDQIGRNTSLGTILLLVPLAKLCHTCPIAVRASDRDDRWMSDELMRMIHQMDHAESAWIYDSIRIANPGGLGKRPEHDVHSSELPCVWQAMQTASDYDDVAMQWTNGYAEVLASERRLRQLVHQGFSIEAAIRREQLTVLASRPDSLIARKLGCDHAAAIMMRVQKLLASHTYGSFAFEHAWSELDRDMRDTNHRNNPGTTADLLAATAFLLLFS